MDHRGWLLPTFAVCSFTSGSMSETSRASRPARGGLAADWLVVRIVRLVSAGLAIAAVHAAALVVQAGGMGLLGVFSRPWSDLKENASSGMWRQHRRPSAWVLASELYLARSGGRCRGFRPRVIARCRGGRAARLGGCGRLSLRAEVSATVFPRFADAFAVEAPAVPPRALGFRRAVVFFTGFFDSPAAFFALAAACFVKPAHTRLSQSGPPLSSSRMSTMTHGSSTGVGFGFWAVRFCETSAIAVAASCFGSSPLLFRTSRSFRAK